MTITDAQATAFLVDRLGGEAGTVSRLAQGVWSTAYAFRRGAAEYVVRFSALEEDFRKDQVAARHSAPNLPIPRVLEVGEAFGGFLCDVAWLAFYAPWYPAWRGIDFGAEAARHYHSIGLVVPCFEARLRCYQVHIGLGDQAWNAYTQNWPQLAATAKRLLGVGSGDGTV